MNPPVSTATLPLPSMLRTPHDAWLSRFWTQINKQTLLCRNPHGRVIQFRLCDVALLDAIALAPAPVYLWAICGRDESLQSTLPPSEDVGWAWVGWLDLQRMTTTDDLMLADRKSTRLNSSHT